jgi:hypothetical protein
MTDDIVDRLYRAIVDELRGRGHEPARPLKVSELYQTLVPYTAVRSALGVELNADYEYALLRLLAGEKGLLRLEPKQAREELRREVDAPYPSVGAFRKFSASDVWVRLPEPGQQAEPEPEQTSADESASAPVMERPASTRSDPPAPHAASPDSASDSLVSGAEPVRMRSGGGAGGANAAPARGPVKLHKSAPEQPARERLARAGAACVFCSEELPTGRRVRFCPHCGGDQRLQPCPRCQAVLEREWRYCISCGHEISGR